METQRKAITEQNIKNQVAFIKAIFFNEEDHLSFEIMLF